MSTVEATVIEALQEALGVPAYGAPPEEHDEAFATVEALGGSRAAFARTHALSVRWWAPSFEEAAALAAEGEAALQALQYGESHPAICRVSMDSGASPRDIDPDTGQARYSTRCEITESI